MNYGVHNVSEEVPNSLFRQILKSVTSIPCKRSVKIHFPMEIIS
jgi:hypothetical protein